MPLPGDLPPWLYVVSIIAFLLAPIITFLLGRRKYSAETRSMGVKDDVSVSDVILRWGQDLRDQNAALAKRVQTLEQHQRAIELHVSGLQQDNHILRLYIRALVRQLTDAGITPTPFDDFATDSGSE